MNKDFEVGQSNELIKFGKIYDLHNLYDYVGIILRGKDRQLQIFFEPNYEYGKGETPISLNFEVVDYLEFSPNFGSRVISGLDEIGYKNPEDHDDEWLMTQQQATDSDHLFFRLEGGDFIRVHSQYATLVEEKQLTAI